MSIKSENTVYCSFCGKSQQEAVLMIASMMTTYICDECVDVAVKMIAKKRADEKFFADARRCTFCTPEPLNA